MGIFPYSSIISTFPLSLPFHPLPYYTKEVNSGLSVSFYFLFPASPNKEIFIEHLLYTEPCIRHSYTCFCYFPQEERGLGWLGLAKVGCRFQGQASHSSSVCLCPQLRYFEAVFVDADRSSYVAV